MKVFLPVSDPQLFKVRPRTGETNVKVYLRNELTQVETVGDLQVGTLDYQFLEVSVANDFKPGEDYQIKILTATEVIIWMGKAYVTAQADLQNYKLGNE